ncbi:MAG TPA: bifunctional DNA-formamidopyrimidine glycosylase/DNA-(apurinic or apyrimidinic site) lyase [Rickettsiales bacterium]|nr:bifunctional DNA-formamidopyrimidine glycosylase/DNA-(apurinic or apyrimidinic site) lyase [Rickettsiales bacterium]
MPELPEVETVCRGLAAHITGSTITHVDVRRRDLRTKLPDRLEKAITGKKVLKIDRRAKYVLIHLQGGEVLIVHLGMSGNLILYDRMPEPLRKHDHVLVMFKPFKLMVFNDARRFGLMELATEKTLESHKLFAGLGPEPFDPVLDKEFYEILQGSKAPIKSVIMDQRKIVGVGNIYACEALFRSHIHPERPAHTVTKKEAGLLLTSIRQVLEEAIESGGSTLRDYVRSSGDAGYFQHHFSVYGRKGEPCVVCKTPVSILRQSGRSTFFCAKCQK